MYTMPNTDRRLNKNGGLVNSTEEVCEEFNDFFCFSVFKRRN